LLATVFGAIRFCPTFVAALVGLYIASAYWFTASTSFANPAVTIARALTNSFAGIAPWSAPAFVAAQFAAAIAAYFVSGWLFAQSEKHI
jgi:glycerol uptake facilitator-like aquaporin